MSTMNDPTLHQRQRSEARFLSGMYMYLIIDLPVLYGVLYDLIGYGVSFDCKSLPAKLTFTTKQGGYEIPLGTKKEVRES
ncbi:hypothetical protein ACTXT7_014275 [Hymenolepis weldensis]